MKTLSLDSRHRILKAYERQDSTSEQVVRRFDISLGMVKKLLSQRQLLGDIGPQHHRCGRKPLLDAVYGRRLQDVVRTRPNAILQELHDALGVDCTLVAIHLVLIRLGLTYKRRSKPASKAAWTWSKGCGSGAAGKARPTRRGWSSSMSRRSKRT